MEAEKFLAEGDLPGALESLQGAVRNDPADPKLRVFLFQLLAVLGQWGRALTQLNVAGEMEPANLAMLQTYREALQCEGYREAVFAGEKSPLIFGDPEDWLALLLQAQQLTAQGQYAQSQELREQAFETAPTTAGKLNDEEFEWIADSDTRLGPVLEGIVNGRYYWIPFHRIHSVNFEAPEDLRDLVWTPAQFTWTNGGQAVGLVPTRYPGAHASEDSGIRMARKTEWQECDAEVFLGHGQRMLAIDSGEHPILEIRTLSLAPLDEGVDAPTPIEGIELPDMGIPGMGLPGADSLPDGEEGSVDG